MTWEQFIYFAIAAVLLWAVGAWAAWREKTTLAYTSTVIGLAFMTIGMLFGALWAKEAWGHYWSWDPKRAQGSSVHVYSMPS